VPPLEIELMTKIRDCDADVLETITIKAPIPERESSVLKTFWYESTVLTTPQP